MKRVALPFSHEGKEEAAMAVDWFASRHELICKEMGSPFAWVHLSSS